MSQSWANIIHNRCQDPFLICNEWSTPPDIVLSHFSSDKDYEVNLLHNCHEQQCYKSEDECSSDSDLSRTWLIQSKHEVVWGRDG